MIKLVRFDHQLVSGERAFAFYETEGEHFLTFGGDYVFHSVAHLEGAIEHDLDRVDHTPEERTETESIKRLANQCLVLATDSAARPPAYRQAADLVERMRRSIAEPKHMLGERVRDGMLETAATMIEELSGMRTDKTHQRWPEVTAFVTKVRAELKHSNHSVMAIVEWLYTALDDLDAWGPTFAMIEEGLADVDRRYKEAKTRSSCSWCKHVIEVVDEDTMKTHAMRCQSSSVVRLLEIARVRLKNIVYAPSECDEAGSIEDATEFLAELDRALGHAADSVLIVPTTETTLGVTSPDWRNVNPSIVVEGPGMPELRAAYDAVPDMLQVTGELGYASQAIMNATRAVLGLDPPSIVEGPGIPELRLVVSTMNPAHAEKLPPEMRRLYEAARIVLRLNEAEITVAASGIVKLVRADNDQPIDVKVYAKGPWSGNTTHCYTCAGCGKITMLPELAPPGGRPVTVTCAGCKSHETTWIGIAVDTVNGNT